MSDFIIRVENLGKKYRIRHQQQERYVALRDVMAKRVMSIGSSVLSGIRSWVPGLRCSASNGHQPISNGNGNHASRDTEYRTPNPQNLTPKTEEFWALKDVSFDVKQGEVVGIIGRNGAGKSTLLKILSWITEPTEGRVRIRGRVASLLEVGTGFHPELTGRENIFVNGAILGMTREEVRRKFDEIVAFAEIEKFLDTPVKRYSSGMYVRLAFAVAAHLEPEILLVDEVLAVGDAEFQKKCLGKMSEVARGGRTVLFVSHNMAAIKSLTTKCFVLNNGRCLFSGITGSAIKFYTNITNENEINAVKDWGCGTHTTICEAQLLDEAGQPTRTYTPGQPLCLEITLTTDGMSNLSLDGFLLDETRTKIGYLSDYQFHGRPLPCKAGRYIYHLELTPLWLASGRYSFDLTTAIANSNWDHYVDTAIEFEVVGCNPSGLSWDFRQRYGYGHLALISGTASRCEDVLRACPDDPRKTT